MMNPNDLEKLRALILKCYDWDVVAENPYCVWVEEQKTKLVPAERISFQLFVKEQLEQAGFL